MMTMVKLSELRTTGEIHDQDMADPEYRREYERTRLANDVAIKVIAYRAAHGLSQAQLARKVGMRQPLEPLDTEMLRRVRADTGDRQLAGLGARGVEQFCQRVIGRG